MMVMPRLSQLRLMPVSFLDTAGDTKRTNRDFGERLLPVPASVSLYRVLDLMQHLRLKGCNA